MAFEDYWLGVDKLKALPGMVIQQLPSSLLSETKKRLMKRRSEEAVELLRVAIEDVNRGSVESIDSSV